MSGGSTIDDRIDSVAGALNVAYAELVDIAVEVLTDPNVWGQWETGSAEKYLAWRTGAQPATIGKVVAIARRVDDLPLCMAAFRDGLLSIDQLAPIARKVPWWADEEICRQAQMMTVEQVRRTAAKYPWTEGIPKPDGTTDGIERESDTETNTETRTDTAASDERASADEGGLAGTSVAAPADRLSFHWDDHDRLRINGEFDRMTGTIIEDALCEARDALFQHGSTDVDWADALHAVAERSLGAVDEPARRARFKTFVHVAANGAATTATGHALDAAAGYLTCDGQRSIVTEHDGVPVSVGRSQRTVPDRTRQMIIHRDGGCRVPGCGNQRWLDVHHIVHWVDGGATDTSNLIALCGKHHRTHHRGGLGIDGDADLPDGVRFTNRHGQPIRASGTRPRPPGRTPPTESVARYKPALRERLDGWAQHFNAPVGYRTGWDHHPQRTASPWLEAARR